MCVCVKVQLVQVTMVSRVRGTCPDLCLSSSGFPASQYLLRLGKDGRQPEKKTDYIYERIKEIWQNYQNPVRLMELLPVAPHPPNT